MSMHVLAGGGVVKVRGVAPGDEEALRTAFRELSPESRYQRFLAHIETLSDDLWRYLCDVDGLDHVALVAFDAGGRRLVGVARFVRLSLDRATAEMAVTIADDWQRRGLGSLLLGLLIDVARGRGIVAFVAYALPTNLAVRRLMARHGALGRRIVGGDEVLWLPLPGTPAERAA
jgi:RimJ/RimL family protein N-acetyltransferase